MLQSTTTATTTTNKKTNIIVITGDDVTLQNLLSLIQKSDNSVRSSDTATRLTISTPKENERNSTCKRRKADLTCVICEDKCFGYNFKVISCGSCKSFFRRNGSQNVDDLKCLTNTNQCDITYRNRRQICRRCRLAKCLSVGMKWNFTTEDEKLTKQRELETNRRLTKNPISIQLLNDSPNPSTEENQSQTDEKMITSELFDTSVQHPTGNYSHSLNLSPVQSTTFSLKNQYLTLDDYARINSVRLSHEKASQLIPITHDLSMLSRIADQRSGLLYSLSGVYNAGMQLITFIRHIPEFELLHEQDRFILVKYNTPMVFFLYLCLKYDVNRDLVIDSNNDNEEYAYACRQLSLYCFGEQLDLQLHRLLCSIKTIADNDPMILQLMMIILVFVKTNSTNDKSDSEESLLGNGKQVFEAQSIYTSLLFRYMMGKYSTYKVAVRQYAQLIQKTIQLQMLARTYQKYLQEKLHGIADDEINPILKSILHLE